MDSLNVPFQYKDVFVILTGKSSVEYGNYSIPIFKVIVYNERGRPDQGRILYIIDEGFIAEIKPKERNIYFLQSAKSINSGEQMIDKYDYNQILSDSNFLPH
jgi:hypothetical protein